VTPSGLSSPRSPEIVRLSERFFTKRGGVLRPAGAEGAWVFIRLQASNTKAGLGPRPR